MKKTCIIVMALVCLIVNAPAQVPCDTAWFSYPDTVVCTGAPSMAPDSIFPFGGNFDSYPSGLVLDSAGLITPASSQPGIYTIYYVSPDTCQDTFSLAIRILQQANAIFSYQMVGCTDGSDLLPTYLGDSGGVFGATPLCAIDTVSGLIDVSASDTGTHTTSYIVGGQCPDTSVFNISLFNRPVASFFYQDTVLCENGTRLEPVVTGDFGGKWQAIPGLALDSVSGRITPWNSIPGIYWVKYQFGLPCPVVDSFQIRILPADNPEFYYPQQNCIAHGNILPDSVMMMGGHFAGNGIVFADSSTGEIDLNQTVPGSYNIQHTTTGICPDSIAKIIVISPQTPAGFYYPDSFYCANSGTATPIITGQGGGIFSADSGLVIDSLTGIVNLQITHTNSFFVQYISPGFCPDTTIKRLTISENGDAGFGYLPFNFCKSDPAPVPVISGDSGGVFRCVFGNILINPNSGQIDLNQSQPSDSIIIRYVVTAPNGGCADSMDFLISIFAPDSNISVTYPQTNYCPTDPNPIPQVTGTTGGTFQAQPPGLRFVSNSTGEIQLNQSQPGTYLVRYFPPGACTDTTNGAILTVHPNDQLNFHYPQSTYCKDSFLISPIGLTDSAGLFSENSGGLIWTNTNLGIFDLQASQPGIYAVNYTSSGQCQRDTTLTLTIFDSPQAVLMSTSDDFEMCEGDTVSFVGFGGDQYEFSINGIVRQPLQFAPTYTPNIPLQNGDEISLMVVNNSGGCADEVKQSITAYSRPTLSVLNAPTGISAGEAVELLIEFLGDSGKITLSAFGNVLDSFTHLNQNQVVFASPDLTDSNKNQTSPQTIDLLLTPQTAFCEGETDTLQISIIPGDGQFFVPGIITPNGDRFNDAWKITWKDGINPDNYAIEVFNRSGGRVWRQTGLAGEWSANGLPDGVYYYTITDSRNQIIKRDGIAIRRR